MTHSMGGTTGWRTPRFTQNVRAIVALEPGGTPFIFPKGYAPKNIKTTFAPLVATALEVELDKFKTLTQMPILLVYGDYIPVIKLQIQGRISGEVSLRWPKPL